MSSQHSQAAPVPQEMHSPRERRGRTRHPISVPASVRLRGPGIAATPTRILDLSEDGIGVQTSASLQPDRTLALELDLGPELDGQHRIRLIGQVAWSQPDGRAGVRFFSPDHSALHAMQQWMFLNAVASAAGSARLPELLSQSAQFAGAPDAGGPIDIPKHDIPKQELFLDEEDRVEAVLSPLHQDINAIVSRALALTGAKGAALALYEGGQLICRAICGTDTPALGAKISIDSGITGECIRLAKVMYCSETAADPRVNQEICADLGIRSILVLPLFAGQRVVGLLEILSQRAGAFDPGDAKSLDLMARPVIGLLFAEGESESLHRGVRDFVGSASVEGGAAELDLGSIERLRRQLARTVVLKTGFNRRALEAVAALAVIGAVTWLIVSQTKTLFSLRQPPAVATTQISPEVPHLASASTTPTSDSAPSLRELKSAAQAGEASAQYAMGARYAIGEGVTQDYATAARWFTLSAKKGYAPAQGMLGAYYWSGRGVHKDLKQAYFWSVLARDGNDEISKDRVDSLVAQLNRSEMVEVQQLVRDWYRKHTASAQAASTTEAAR